MTKVNVTQFHSNFDCTHPFSSSGAKLWLAANTELTWTVPGEATQKFRANFAMASTAEVWVKLNSAVVVPVAGTIVDSYNEQLRPDYMYVIGGDVLHFISTGTPQVGVSLLALPG